MPSSARRFTRNSDWRARSDAPCQFTAHTHSNLAFGDQLACRSETSASRCSASANNGALELPVHRLPPDRVIQTVTVASRYRWTFAQHQYREPRLAARSGARFKGGSAGCLSVRRPDDYGGGRARTGPGRRRRDGAAVETCPTVARWAPPSGPTNIPSTRGGSVPTDGRWPRPAPIRRCGCGTPVEATNGSRSATASARPSVRNLSKSDGTPAPRTSPITAPARESGGRWPCPEAVAALAPYKDQVMHPLLEEDTAASPPLNSLGRRRSPAAVVGYLAGRPPRSKVSAPRRPTAYRRNHRCDRRGRWRATAPRPPGQRADRRAVARASPGSSGPVSTKPATTSAKSSGSAMRCGVCRRLTSRAR